VDALTAEVEKIAPTVPRDAHALSACNADLTTPLLDVNHEAWQAPLGFERDARRGHELERR